MRMRTTLIALLMLLGTVAYAQEAAPVDLPIYPGAEANMEINLSNADILPTLKAMLPMLGEKYAQILGEITPEDIASVFKDVKRIQFVTIDVAKSGVSEADVAAYYSKNLPAGQWSRIFWQSKAPAGTVAVYSGSGAETLYGFRVRSVKSEETTVRRVEAIKVEGKVDFVKLLTLAGKFLGGAAAPK